LSVPVAKTDFVEGMGQFSPDGKWGAYQSDKSGRDEIYVQPFPGPGADVRVSTDGGGQVRWRRDGKELFYVAADGTLMAVPFRVASAPDPSTPVHLFITHLWGGSVGYAPRYDVSADGRRFLMNTTEPVTSSITLILNRKTKP
jgi:hypothetical protein